MAHMASDGKAFTNKPPMKAHERSLGRMAQHSEAGGAGDPLQQPGEQGIDKSDKPMMTHHHPDGTHTTVHESGMEHNHENLEALKSHLDQFIDEEEGEPQEHEHEAEPEYE